MLEHTTQQFNAACQQAATILGAECTERPGWPPQCLLSRNTTTVSVLRVRKSLGGHYWELLLLDDEPAGLALANMLDVDEGDVEGLVLALATLLPGDAG